MSKEREKAASSSDIWSKSWLPAYLLQKRDNIRSYLVNDSTFFIDPANLLCEAWTSYKNITSNDFYQSLGTKIPELLTKCINDQEIRKTLTTDDGMGGIEGKLWVNYDDDGQYLTFGLFFPKESELKIFSAKIYKNKSVSFYLRDQNRKIVATQDNISNEQINQILDRLDNVFQDNSA